MFSDKFTVSIVGNDFQRLHCFKNMLVDCIITVAHKHVIESVS